VTAALCRAAAACQALVTYLERRAEDALGRLAVGGPAGLVLDARMVTALPRELGLEVLRRAAHRLGEPGPQRGAVHRALRRALEEPPPRRPARLGRLAVERSGSRLRVGSAALPALSPRHLPVPGQVALPEAGVLLSTRCVPRPAGYASPRDSRHAAFDADRLPAVLLVRARRPGERFAPFGAPGSRRLKSVLIDAGIPRWDRPRLPLVEADGEIIWIPGVRRGRAAPVTSATRRILEVTLGSL
jgi:tRNA(Ile)-lysidine synthase